MKLITTTYNNFKKETKIEEHAWKDGNAREMCVVNLYPEVEYQTFHGFGGAITEAAAHTYSKMSKENQEKVIDNYFGINGNAYSLVRGHIDSCDFSLNNYCAISDEEDKEFKTFSLARDEQTIIPMMLAAQEKKGEPLDLMLTPWSPPAFMKTNLERNHGGKLKPEYRQMWADYICHYIKEYEKRGLKVNRLTIQNEPMATQTWDSCVFEALEEKEFLRDYLYPTLQKNGLTDVKINIWDHNKEIMFERARDIIDEETDHMVDGVAFHWYTGDHFEAISLVRDVYPGKELIFTEGCVEYSRFDSNELRNAQMYAHDILGNLNAGMTGFIDWNVLLDEKGGPNHVNNFCDAPMMYDTDKDVVVEKLSFHYIGHFSKYIRKGAKRIAFTRYTDKLEVTAFKNTDGSVAAVLLNRSEEAKKVNLRVQGKHTEFEVPASAIVTCVIE